MYDLNRWTFFAYIYILHKMLHGITADVRFWKASKSHQKRVVIKKMITRKNTHMYYNGNYSSFFLKTYKLGTNYHDSDHFSHICMVKHEFFMRLHYCVTYMGFIFVTEKNLDRMLYKYKIEKKSKNMSFIERRPLSYTNAMVPTSFIKNRCE